MISIRCPASCGEIFQGPVNNQEALISYAIDLYSVVRLEKGKRRTGSNQDKAYHAMEETLKYFDRPESLLKDYRLIIKSDIPRGKGMASSTADVAGAVMLSAKMLQFPMTEDILGKIAAKVEPTDSTLFSKLSLFNSKSGKRVRSYGPYPKGRVLILEGFSTVDTLEYHRQHSKTKALKLYQQKENLNNCYQTGVIEKPIRVAQAFEAWEKKRDNISLKELGKLATVSARAHQQILPKPGLEKIIKLSSQSGAYGVNTAHSGSVLGVLYHEAFFDKKGFIKKIQQEGLRKHYPILRDHRLIPGGLQWMKY